MSFVMWHHRRARNTSTSSSCHRRRSRHDTRSSSSTESAWASGTPGTAISTRRRERHGLLLGPYESHARARWLESLPGDFAHQLFGDDLGRIETYIEAACARVPLLASAGVRRVINGPIPYAPDGNPLMGPAAGARNFFHCCAFTFGIAQAGGAGRVMAEWVVNGEPDWDVWPLDCRRYLRSVNRTYVLAKALETYQHEYGVAYPQEERPAGRPEKTSPLYDHLRAQGAVFGARGGWERAVYYAGPDDPAGPERSFRRPHWHRAVERECAAVANGVAVLDLPGSGKFEIEGAGAAAVPDRPAASRSARGRQRRRGAGSARLWQVRDRGRGGRRVARSPARRPAAPRGPHGAQPVLLTARGHRERDDRVAPAGWAFLVDVRRCRRAARRAL